MRNKRIIRYLAIGAVLMSLVLSGCGQSSDNDISREENEDMQIDVETQTNEETQSNVDIQTDEDIRIEEETLPQSDYVQADFNTALIRFIDESGFGEKNYMVSPTSFKAALSLAVAGADTETKEELIHAMGFSDMDDLNAWYTSVSNLIDDFNSEITAYGNAFGGDDLMTDNGQDKGNSLVMLNSIWHNTDREGKFGPDYISYVAEHYQAEANDVSSKEITNKVNSWVNDGTGGLIPSVSDDLSMVNAVLVNTLYLKSGWVNTFNANATETDEFTNITDQKVQKEFMKMKENLRFYEDSTGKMVVLPLKGGVDAIFVLGEIEDMEKALEEADYEKVVVKLPKFEVESSFSEKELISFMEQRGAALAFSGDADFSVMCPESSWMISDIIQKTRIKVDEDGLEAAAATAMIMLNSAPPSGEKPKEFIADRPFRFYICGGENDSEVLFCGQIVQ